ncbi:hypothetical protein SAMN05444157_0190 [Frankineae bacterium MT45]|nr:hypothetical protein SAMN05444157_0190 [Frankineae bacterium MT45]
MSEHSKPADRDEMPITRLLNRPRISASLDLFMAASAGVQAAIQYRNGGLWVVWAVLAVACGLIAISTLRGGKRGRK